MHSSPQNEQTRQQRGMRNVKTRRGLGGGYLYQNFSCQYLISHLYCIIRSNKPKYLSFKRSSVNTIFFLFLPSRRWKYPYASVFQWNLWSQTQSFCRA